MNFDFNFLKSSKSFETLGQVAMSKMMSDRNVMQSSQAFEKYLDLNKFQQFFD